MPSAGPGPLNLITDVPGLGVGQAMDAAARSRGHRDRRRRAGGLRRRRARRRPGHPRDRRACPRDPGGGGGRRRPLRRLGLWPGRRRRRGRLAGEPRAGLRPERPARRSALAHRSGGDPLRSGQRRRQGLGTRSALRRAGHRGGARRRAPLRPGNGRSRGGRHGRIAEGWRGLGVVRDLGRLCGGRPGGGEQLRVGHRPGRPGLLGRAVRDRRRVRRRGAAWEMPPRARTTGAWAKAGRPDADQHHHSLRGHRRRPDARPGRAPGHDGPGGPRPRDPPGPRPVRRRRGLRPFHRPAARGRAVRPHRDAPRRRGGRLPGPSGGARRLRGDALAGNRDALLARSAGCG